MCRRPRALSCAILSCFIFVLVAPQAFAQDLKGRPLYEALKKFELKGKASVSNLALKRDRGEMTFTGDFYFAAPVNGKVTGAVFIGTGKFSAPSPSLPYEKENLKWFIDNAEKAESDFGNAVLRFSDDTFSIIGKNADASAAPSSEAQKLAQELDPRLLKEAGINVSERLLVSIANNENPGIFVAQYDKGTRGRFFLVIDQQTRIPGSAFVINAGEKVLLFQYAPYYYGEDIWIATYSEDDYKKGKVSYSDQFDLVNPLKYTMTVDLKDPRSKIRTQMRIDFESLVDNLTAIPMRINQGLIAYDNDRLKHSMRVQNAKFEGQDLAYVQEEWEVGLAFLLPKAMKKGDKFSVDVMLEGDIIDKQRVFQNNYFPSSNENWFPQHGYLKRSQFDLSFRHRKEDKVSSIGKLVKEGVELPDDPNLRLTQYVMDYPVALVSFAAGNYERHSATRTLKYGEQPLDFYSVPASVANIKESFVLTEMGNALEYFSAVFGPYPYKDFRASVHPEGFGQGFPTNLFIAPADEANRDVYKFISHETSHQWWGNLVAWRSYRDQWLSEGFAEYSGMLYTLVRTKNEGALRDQIKTARFVQTAVPKTDQGVGKGKISEVGPLILGLRLNTRKSTNGYRNLTYYKGALVLRMLHFLFSNPSTDPNQSGTENPFFAMMSKFAKAFENKAASTEDFEKIAGEEWAKTPIAQQFGLKDLGWFFQQWVFEAKLPNYRLDYKIDEANGKIILSGNVIQENAGDKWFMPLPIVCKFGKQVGHMFVYANGPTTPFKMELPQKPTSVELDPDLWILTDKTTTKKL